MLSLTREGARLRRDDDFSPPPSKSVSSHSPRDAPMDNSNMQDRSRGRFEMSPPPRNQAAERRLVLPDPLTLRYLEEEGCIKTIERWRQLSGYELYIVEQWACSRQSPIIVVATYTGDEKHSIAVSVVLVPQDEALWSARLRQYFDTASRYNARPKETDSGELLITNLSSFPSALTVVAVPDGDVRNHRELFMANEDLKRLGCSGRSGLTLTEPTEATQAKFHQLYKTNDRVPILQAVMELVKLCQVALYMFEKLGSQYIDGLLCDVTEGAISHWWAEVGTEHYNYEPTDGILGPTTVAALLGMLMGARNRLYWFGAPVSKDVFDIEATKRGVAYFQKQQKLEQTRRLDRQTLFRLHTATAKGAAGEGWGVQKAVKSTVTEFGGKRGELVMDMVSGRDKAGLTDIETLDIDRLISLAYGDRPRWLWHGKARKSASESVGGDQDLGSMLFGKGEATKISSRRTHSLPPDEHAEVKRKEDGAAGAEAALPLGSTSNLGDMSGDRDALRRGVFKSVTDKMSDARSGLGRIKDAVGGSRRGPTGRLTLSIKEDTPEPGGGSATLSSSANSAAMTSSPALIGRAFTWKGKPDEYLATLKRLEDDMSGQNDEAQLSEASTKKPRPALKSVEELTPVVLDPGQSLRTAESETHKVADHKASSAGQPVVDDGESQEPLPGNEQKAGRAGRAGSNTPSLARRRSCGISDLGVRREADESRWPRRMSFGDAAEAILTWQEVIDMTDMADFFGCAEAHAGAVSRLNRLIEEIAGQVAPWAESKVKDVEILNQRYEHDKAELRGLHRQLNEMIERVRYHSDGVLSEQRESLTESVKKIEVLVARLEYEINGLVQKVHDVEEGVQNFARQVDHVEDRAAELKDALETEGWLHWFVRTLTGLGTGPNITRES